MLKKRIRKLLAVILVAITFFNTIPNPVYATQSTRDKLNDAQKQLNEAKDKVDDQKDEVGKLDNRKKELKREIQNLNDELAVIEGRISDLNTQIADKEEEIAQTQAALEEALNTEKEQYEAMKKRIQFMYKDSKNLYIDMLFSAKSFKDFITLNNYMESLARYDEDKFEEYQNIRKTIEVLEAKLEDDKAQLDVLKAEAEEEKANVMVVIENTQIKMGEYSDLLEEAEAELLAYEAELKAKENDVETLKKQLEEEMRLSALAAKSVWRDISQVTFDPGDRYMLAVLIYCEAGGEPYEGQIAVGAVVINRMLSSVYPDTMYDVIHQYKQFSPVYSGRFDQYMAIGKTNQSCYNAADTAMSGVSNVGNCLHFRTPIPGLTGIQIGNHIFY